MKQIFFCIWLLLTTVPLFSETEFKFRVWLKDKAGTPYSTDYPADFLSEKAIERRKSQQIRIDETDLPVNPAYVHQIINTGVKEITRSRWMNTVVISSPDSSSASRISALPFVKKIDLVWKTPENEGTSIAYEGKSFRKQKNYSDYGDALYQIAIHNGDKLHTAGFTGEGMTIAVIDAGFMNIDRNPLFDNRKIIGTHNFVSPDIDPYVAGNHGALVLSAMAAEKKGTFIGSAPKARYWLLCSEDEHSEFPIEEDLWTTAAEFADSAGVDIISSSLGYFKFDIPELNYNQLNLDGKTAFISRAATIGSQKGMIIVNSAGNEGNNEWKKILFPADVENILTVGGIDRNMNPSEFSSFGYTSDLRVKPDVVSIGTNTTLVGLDGTILQSDGTSFATPVISGLTACLWQALPHLSAQEIIKLIRKNSSQYNNPDPQKGYGTPDMYAAYRQAVSELKKNNTEPLSVYYDTSNNEGMLILQNIPENGQQYNVSIYTAQGTLKTVLRLQEACQTISTRDFAPGLYIVQVQGYGININSKFIKPW